VLWCIVPYVCVAACLGLVDRVSVDWEGVYRWKDGVVPGVNIDVGLDGPRWVGETIM
jgi:hypothetical protein